MKQQISTFFAISVAILTILPVVLVFAQNCTSAGDKYKPTCSTALKKLLGTDVKCSKLDCVTSLTAEDCLSGEVFEENAAHCGCCPACVKTAVAQPGCKCDTTYFERPGDGRQFWPVVKYNCIQGTYCSKTTGLCEVLPAESSLGFTCDQLRGLYYTVDGQDRRKFYWEPTCNEDGSFAPVQCKGDPGVIGSICYCSNPEGRRLFGQAPYGLETRKNMTCGCSLHVYRLREENGMTTSIHCTEEGNYEPLQCDGNSGLCYCVDEKTGEIKGDVLPEQYWTSLPCYDKKKLGEYYYRKCDSAWIAASRIQEEASLHGVGPEYFQLETFRCDYDGSYGAYQYKGTNEFCADKNGNQIEGYFRARQYSPLTCHCARDKLLYAESFPSYRGECRTEGEIGSYPEVAEEASRGEAYCLDRDGFQYNKVSKDDKCCLEEKQDQCPPGLDENECKRKGIRRCMDMPTGSPY